MGYYSRRHYERLSNGGPDKPGDKERRIREQQAAEQANREMVERFAPLTPEKMPEALKWQDARIKDLLEASDAR